MIALQSDVRVYLACGYTDMRKGMQGLAMLVQQVLAEDPFNGALYAFRGRRGNLLKLVWHDGIGLCVLTKPLERGHFIWPMTSTGSIALSAGQLSTLFEGCECAQPETGAGRLMRIGAITLESLAATRAVRVIIMRCADRSRGTACDDPAVLQRMLQEVVPELQAENEKLWQLIQRLLRHRYGPRSQKSTSINCSTMRHFLALRNPRQVRRA